MSHDRVSFFVVFALIDTSLWDISAKIETRSIFFPVGTNYSLDE